MQERPQPARPRRRSGGNRNAPAERKGVISVHGVEKSFVGRKVVKGVSLYLRRGEAVGLLGPNGAGKTTVFYMMTGLIPADKGRIESLDGYDVTALPMYQRARLGIGYLPQEASIFRGLSVEQNIRAVLEVVERDPETAAARSRWAAGRVRQHYARRKDAGHRFRRRAPPGGDRPLAGHTAKLHAAR